MEMTLFIDSSEANLPSLVREVLDQCQKQHISATISPEGKCILICGSLMYIWNFFTKDSTVPHATKLNLPTTGLKYSASSVAIFKTSKQRQYGVLAVSPEGMVRYWSEVGRPHKDESIPLNSEVAQSISPIDSLNHKQRFLISTTTASFYILELYHSYEGHESLNIHHINTNPQGGIGRRMSMIFFGHSNLGKEQIIKAICVHGIRGLSLGNADVIAVLAKSLRFYSFDNQTLNNEIDILEVVSEEMKRTSMNTVSKVTVHDAVLYKRGLLMLISVIRNIVERDQPRTFYLAYLEGQKSSSNDQIKFKTFVPIKMPGIMKIYENANKTVHSALYITDENECAIVFSKSLILVKNPLSSDSGAAFIEDINDTLLGSAALNGYCRLILKEAGACTLRRLPKFYDLTFWKKYRSQLQETSSQASYDASAFDLFYKAFINFCSKDLNSSKEILDELLEQPHVNAAELVTNLLTLFMDKIPLEKIQTTTEIDETSRFKSILKQLSSKLSCYKMIVIFLQHFSIVSKIEGTLGSQQNRIGRAVAVEFGQKLVSMVFTANWLFQNKHQHMLALQAIRTTGDDNRRQDSDISSNTLIDSINYVFSKISMWHKLAPTAVKFGEGELAKCLTSQSRGNVIIEIGSLLSSIAEGIREATSEEWAILPIEGAASWLNHQSLLTSFLTQLNLSLNFLEHDRHSLASPNQLVELTMNLANFVLSQQNHSQRNNSQIIAKFNQIGYNALALQLAEKYKDFTMLVENCYKITDEKKRTESLENYKKMFADSNFDLFLYDFYRSRGMVDNLLKEKGNRVEQFLHSHEGIRWIRCIQDGEYKKARKILKSMSEHETDSKKRLIELSLCKLCALCEERKDIGELAELSETIRKFYGSSNNTTS